MPQNESPSTFSEDPATERLSRPPAVVPHSERSVRLITLFEPSPRTYTIGDEAVLGRSRHATVRLTQTGISRRHARLFRDERGEFIVEDLGSRNGTFVNGMRIQRQVLAFGDRIQLGHRAILSFERASAEEERRAQHQKMEAIGRLSAGIAHEFNNFLAVIVSSLDYLNTVVGEQLPQQADVAECLEDAMSAANQARLVTRQLLTFSRPAEQEHVDVEISSLLREVVQLVRRTFDRTIVVELEVEQDLWVRGDRALLFQALMNLCLNARDAMPNGGRLQIVGRRSTRGVWDSILIEVSDTGSGIDERALPRLFEPFYTTKDGSRGTGLGLAMVYGTVRSHGGDIDVTTRAGRGTSFAILLPDVVGPRGERAVSRTTASSIRAEGASRVLVVDDEPLVRRSVQRILKQAGHEVMTACNGAEAVELYERHTVDIGIVLLDLNMPVMTGREALGRLKALNPTVRVVVLSAYAHDERDDLLAEGVLAVLDKPCDAKQLRDALRLAVSC